MQNVYDESGTVVAATADNPTLPDGANCHWQNGHPIFPDPENQKINDAQRIADYAAAASDAVVGEHGPEYADGFEAGFISANRLPASASAVEIVQAIVDGHTQFFADLGYATGFNPEIAKIAVQKVIDAYPKASSSAVELAMQILRLIGTTNNAVDESAALIQAAWDTIVGEHVTAKLRPMDTAPKDGTRILLYAEGELSICAWRLIGWLVVHDSHDWQAVEYTPDEAKGWLPLPKVSA